MKIRDMVLAYNESAKRTEELGRQIGNDIVDILIGILPGIYYELGGDKYGIETLYFGVRDAEKEKQSWEKILSKVGEQDVQPV